MKILQINASYKPAYIYGGPTMSVSKLSEQLIAAGYPVQVFTTTANGTTELAMITNAITMVDSVPVHYFSRLTKDHSHFSPRLLLAVWKHAKEFDIVHIHAWWNTVSVLSCFIATLKGVPVVLSPRGTLSNYSFSNRNSFYKKCIHFLLGKHLLHKCSIHATSDHEKMSLEYFKPRSITVIPNFVDLPVDHISKTDHSSKGLKLLFFSRIEEKKGLDILFEALASVAIPYHLTIAGSGNEVYIDSLKQLAAQKNIKSHITWVGFRGDDKFDVLATHDVLVLPSHDENFGNVVIESLSVGTAVLISEQVGLADYVKQNELGWICRTEPASITAAIDQVSKPQLSAIKEKAPGIIYHDFSEQALLQQYKNMYHQTLTNG